MQKNGGCFVLPPEYCNEAIQRLCYLMPTPEHRSEGMWAIIGSIFILTYTFFLNKWITFETDQMLAGKENSGWPLETLALVWLGVRATWVLCGACIVIGLARIITNR